jgi:hypothetical protein
MMDARLEQACGAFEQMVIATLVAPVARTISVAAGESTDDSLYGDAAITGDPAAAQLAESLFPQMFAQALEQAGGLGLRAALARAITHEP